MHIVSTTTIISLHERFYTHTALQYSDSKFTLFLKYFSFQRKCIDLYSYIKRKLILRDIQKGIYTLQYVAVFWQ